jgi:hypothetical protein
VKRKELAEHRRKLAERADPTSTLPAESKTNDRPAGSSRSISSENEESSNETSKRTVRHRNRAK